MDDTPISERPEALDWSRVSRVSRNKAQVNYPGSLQATSTASFLSAIAWLFAFLVVIGGVLLVLYSDPLYERRDASFFTRHPYAVTGIAIAVAGSIQMMAVVMAANFVKATMAFHSMAGAFFQAFAEASLETKNSGPNAQVEDAQRPQDSPPIKTESNTRSGNPSAYGNLPGWYPDPQRIHRQGKQLRWWDGDKWTGP